MSMLLSLVLSLVEWMGKLHQKWIHLVTAGKRCDPVASMTKEGTYIIYVITLPQYRQSAWSVTVC